jgi:ALG11 mannosyltransferase N-terminus
VELKRRRWIEDASWPRLTLLGQSLGSVVLAYEALSTFVPDVFIGANGSSRPWLAPDALATHHFPFKQILWVTHLPTRSFDSHSLPCR